MEHWGFGFENKVVLAKTLKMWVLDFFLWYQLHKSRCELVQNKYENPKRKIQFSGSSNRIFDCLVLLVFSTFLSKTLSNYVKNFVCILTSVFMQLNKNKKLFSTFAKVSIRNRLIKVIRAQKVFFIYSKSSK